MSIVVGIVFVISVVLDWGIRWNILIGLIVLSYQIAESEARIAKMIKEEMSKTIDVKVNKE